MYLLAGACDPDCKKMTLQVYGQDRREVAVRAGAEDTPILTFTPRSTGNVHLSVSMANCSRPPCTYGMRLFSAVSDTASIIVPVWLKSKPPGADVYMIPLDVFQRDTAIARKPDRLVDSHVQEGKTDVLSEQRLMTYMAIFKLGKKERHQRVSTLLVDTARVYVEFR